MAGTSGGGSGALWDLGVEALPIQGNVADGSTAAGYPVVEAGVDGSGNVQAILTDTSGRQVIIGAAADGATATGNPVLIAGADGSGNAQTIATDTTGRVIITGAVADGATMAGNPVVGGGVDSSGNVQQFKVDTNGALYVIAQEAGATTLSNNQVAIAVTGTAVPLAASTTPILSVTIKAMQGNGGREVYIGDSSVSTSNGYQLSKGDTVSMEIDDLNKVYVNGIAGDKVSYIAIN